MINLLYFVFAFGAAIFLLFVSVVCVFITSECRNYLRLLKAYLKSYLIVKGFPGVVLKRDFKI